MDDVPSQLWIERLGEGGGFVRRLHPLFPVDLVQLDDVQGVFLSKTNDPCMGQLLGNPESDIILRALFERPHAQSPQLDLCFISVRDNRDSFVFEDEVAISHGNLLIRQPPFPRCCL